MFRSIAEDVRRAFETGNMITRIIILNIIIYMITALMEAFFPSLAGSVLEWLAIPGDLSRLITRPWTLITHMFIHSGFWHMAWNMLMLYWFGMITGDLLGDRRILPIYIAGGLTGALFYILSYQLLPGIGFMAMGASAAVLAIVWAAVTTAPEYNMRLILLGDVRIKYIGLFLLFFDLIGVRSAYNSGGHIAHIGGALFGMGFVYLLRQGYDITQTITAVVEYFKGWGRHSGKSRPALRVEHRSNHRTPNRTNRQNRGADQQEIVDRILEKIKVTGYESLSPEEKETLFKASKEN